MKASYPRFSCEWLSPVLTFCGCCPSPSSFTRIHIVRSLLEFSLTYKLPFQLAHFPLAINLQQCALLLYLVLKLKKTSKLIHSWKCSPFHSTRPKLAKSHMKIIFLTSFIRKCLYVSESSSFHPSSVGAYMPGMLLQFLFVGPKIACCRLHILCAGNICLCVSVCVYVDVAW